MKTYIHTVGPHGQSAALKLTLTLLAVLATALPPLVRGQSYPLYTPVHIRAPDPITDEFGSPLRGNADLSANKRDLVQILWASNSVAYAPAYDGTPDPRNAPVDGGTLGIGYLVSPSIPMPGRFAASLSSPRPSQNSRIFVRVYNAPTTEEASFYADSQIMTVNNNELLTAIFGATTNAIDPRDNDGDGLNNSWEKSLASDADNADTDGDHMSDGDEFRAGTDLLDEYSVFVTVRLQPDANGDALLTWDSVAGKSYQVECMDGAHAGPLSYSNITAVITADGPQTQTVIPNGLDSETCKYRVRLVE